MRNRLTSLLGALAIGSATPAFALAQEPPTPEMQVFWALQDYCIAVDGDRTDAMAAADADGLWKPPAGTMDDGPFANMDSRFSVSDVGLFVFVGDAVDENGVNGGSMCAVGANNLRAPVLADLINAWLGGHGGDFSDDADMKMFAYVQEDGGRRRISSDTSDEEAERFAAEERLRAIIVKTDVGGLNFIGLFKPSAVVLSEPQ